MSRHVWAFNRRTRQKRRIPEGWLQPNVFGGNWSLTPSSRRRESSAPVAPEPASTEAGLSVDPAQPDEPREDK